MNTFTITTLGCKVNQYESQQIRQLLEKLGLRQVQQNSKSDLAVIHTCCVTHTAASKSRQIIRKALKANPDCKVIATGCLTSTDTDETTNLSSEIRLVSREESLPDVIRQVVSSSINTQEVTQLGCEITSNISRTANGHKIKNKKGLPTKDDPLRLDSLSTFKGQSRAFLKIQDGCDAFCTYCIIPKIRNRLWSNTPQSIIKEAKAMVDTGHKEIVLTGIFLGAFGQNTTLRKNWDSNTQNDFFDLLEEIASIQGLKRLRLSSLEPGDVTPKLLALFKKYNNLVPHLHLPLQAGSSRILKRMNRQYNAGQYIDMIDMVKTELDRPAITTDIIVGFPGETNEDFEKTIEITQYAGFAKTHIFPFSLRKGTAAEKMDGHLPPQIIKERAANLSQLDKQLQSSFRNQFANENISVIIENEKSQTGRCERYFEVKILDGNFKKGDCINAKLQKNCQDAIVIK